MSNTFIHTERRPAVYFFHIPKTGGTSLRYFLADQYNDADRCPAEDWNALASVSDSDMGRYRLFFGHFTANFATYLPDAVRSVTFLRSPVGRTISTIRHMIRDPLFHPLHERVKGRTVSEVIRDDLVMATLQNTQTKLLSFDVPMADVLEYVRRQKAANRYIDLGELRWKSSADKAIKTLEAYDFVGLMDHFEDYILQMCEAFDYVPPDVLPEFNFAPDSYNPNHDLSAADIDRMRGFLAEDIRVFDHFRTRSRAHKTRHQIFSQLLTKGILSQPTGPFELDLGRPFIGSGWYLPELQRGSIRRWSGPATKATIYLPLNRASKHSIRVEAWKPEAADEIDAYVEGENLEVHKTSSQGLVSLDIDLPALGQNPSSVTKLVLDSKTVRRPSEGDKDVRTLGLLLSSVKIV